MLVRGIENPVGGRQIGCEVDEGTVHLVVEDAARLQPGGDAVDGPGRRPEGRLQFAAGILEPAVVRAAGVPRRRTASARAGSMFCMARASVKAVLVSLRG